MPDKDETLLSPEDLQKSLAQLEQLADGLEAVSKAYGGVSVEHSGTYGSEGQQGGGLAGAGDIGGLDTLQIGKLVDSGAIDPGPALLGHLSGQDASQFGMGRMAGYLHGYAHGKAGKDMDVGDGKDDKYMEGYKRGYMVGHVPAQKSQQNQDNPDPLEKSELDKLRERPAIEQAIDASDFMEQLTLGTGEALDGVRKSLRDLQSGQTKINDTFAKSLIQISEHVERSSGVINELAKRLDIVERTPNPPKGALNKSQAAARAAEKGMPGEAGGGGEETKLTKSQLVSTLTYMALEKSVKEIGGRPTSQLAVMAEAGNVIDDETIVAARDFLKNNPNEAQRALNYH